MVLSIAMTNARDYCKEKYGIEYFKTLPFPTPFIKSLFYYLKYMSDEYSIAFDFEPNEELPERIRINKGSEYRTKSLNDFELFGHTHSEWLELPVPSVQDICDMRVCFPEFLLNHAGMGIVYSVEDLDKWKSYCKKHKNDKRLGERVLDFMWTKKDMGIEEKLPMEYYENPYAFEIGRNYFFEKTGVKVAPITNATTIQLPFKERILKRNEL